MIKVIIINIIIIKIIIINIIIIKVIIINIINILSLLHPLVRLNVEAPLAVQLLASSYQSQLLNIHFGPLNRTLNRPSMNLYSIKRNILKRNEETMKGMKKRKIEMGVVEKEEGEKRRGGG